MAASLQYLHGIEIIEVDDGIRPVQTVKSSIIGVVGTAPNADPDLFPYNEPILFLGDQRKAALLGAGGTLRDALMDIFSIVGATVVVVRVPQGNTTSETMTNVMGDPITKTGVWAFLRSNGQVHVKPRILIAPGFTGERPTDGLQRGVINDSGTGYVAVSGLVDLVITGDGVGAAAKGTITNAGIEAVVVTNPGHRYTQMQINAPAPQAGGRQAVLSAVLGVAANPVAKALEAVAPRLRAIALIDGPNISNETAVTFRTDFASDRLMVLDPYPLVWSRTLNTYVPRPPSAIAAGMQCLIDNTKGFWHPFSNQPLPMVGGTSRPVAWELENPDTESNYLNANEVTPVVRIDSASQGGFRFWGLRSCATDPLWAFMSVRRTADMIYESIIEGFLWIMDKPLSAQRVVDGVETVNYYLRTLKRRGATLGGKAWIDNGLNSRDQLLAGKLAISFDFEPPAPIERLSFYAARQSLYYNVLLDQIQSELAISGAIYQQTQAGATVIT